MNKPRLRRASIVILIVFLLSLFGSVVSARADEATVELFRIDKTFVILKITFPNDISGSFAGELAGKHFDCLTIPSNVLICIGRFREGSDPSFLTIYNTESEEVILQEVVTTPKAPGKGPGEEQPAPVETPPPGDDDDDCVECF